MGRHIGIACVVVLVATAAWWWSSREDVPPLEGDGARTDAPATKSQDGKATARVPTLRGRPQPDMPLGKKEGGVHGVVLGADGKPIADVAVYALYVDWHHGEIVLAAAARSDEQGRYQLRVPAKWPRVIVLGFGNGHVSDVDWPKHWRGKRTPPQLRAQVSAQAWHAHDLRMRRAARVSGTVRRPDGEPATAATVHVVGPVGYQPFPWRVLPGVPVNAEGRYEITWLPESENLGVAAQLKGHIEILGGMTSGLTPGATVTRDLQFTRPHRAELTVTDEDGKPVAGAEVDFEWIRFPGVDSMEVARTAYTDAGGRAAWAPVPSDGLSASVRKDGYVTFGYSERDNYGYVFEQTATGLWTGRATFVRLASIRGRLVWPAGTPGRERAHVRAKGPTGEGFALVADDGAFEVRTPPTGAFTLKAHDNRNGDVWKGEGEAEAGDTDVVLHMKLTQKAEVVDRSSWGVWSLGLRMADGRTPASIHIDDVGRAATYVPDFDAIELVDGRLEFRVAPGKESAWISLWLGRTKDNEPVPPIVLGPFGPEGGSRDVTLPRPRTIRGRVVDHTGAPLQGVEVEATPVHGGADEYIYRHDAALTGADGVFVLRGLVQDEYDVVVKPYGHWILPATQRVANGSADLRLEMTKPVRHRITVRTADGLKVSEALVSAYQRNGARGPDADYESIHTKTNTEGEAILDGLEAGGTYSLDVYCACDVETFKRSENEAWTPRDTVVIVEPTK